MATWAQRRDDLVAIGRVQAAVFSGGDEPTSNDVIVGILNSLVAITELGAIMDGQVGQVTLEAASATHTADSLRAVVDTISQQIISHT